MNRKKIEKERKQCVENIYDRKRRRKLQTCLECHVKTNSSAKVQSKNTNPTWYPIIILFPLSSCSPLPAPALTINRLTFLSLRYEKSAAGGGACEAGMLFSNLQAACMRKCRRPRRRSSIPGTNGSVPATRTLPDVDSGSSAPSQPRPPRSAKEARSS